MTRKIVFVDANDALTAVMERLSAEHGIAVTINRQPDIRSDALPALLDGVDTAIIDHTALPTDLARHCPALRNVVFLGTGARSYMNPEELAELGIAVHIIKGYGDTAVAECAMALMWAAARGLAKMDAGMRAGHWLRTEGMQLTGKTLGLIGFGGIAAELARLATGIGMQVLAWNRSEKTAANVSFVDLDKLLAQSHVVSLHLSLTEETQGFLSKVHLSRMRPGAILINTARGALVDEAAMIEALRTGHLTHAALDVFVTEPLPADHVLTTLPNVTLSAHSGFRTPEANDNLIAAALVHCDRILRG